MVDADAVVSALARAGFSWWTGVPCSYLGPLIDAASESTEARYVNAVNEGDAVAMASGLELGGRPSVVVLQNSGLGNAVDPLTSLCHVYRVPVLLIISVRGHPADPPDAAHHAFMGAISESLLDVLQIPHQPMPANAAELDAAISRALDHFDRVGRPVAWLVRKGTFAPRSCTRVAASARAPQAQLTGERGPAGVRRLDVLRAVRGAVLPQEVIISTTGYTSRELLGLGDRDTQLYMSGSMGCAAGLGLGVALAQPATRVVVIDGDGAVLMRLGVTTMIGSTAPTNFVHVVLDNGSYESTGGQVSASNSVDFPALAVAAGYRRVVIARDAAAIRDALRATVQGPTFVYVPILPGLAEAAPRPEQSPEALAKRFRATMSGGAHT